MTGEPAPYDRDQDLVDGTRTDGRPRVRVYRPEEVAVVLGRGSRLALELHREAIERDAVPVYRRPGGGCAVVLDPGNVVVALTVPQQGAPRPRELFASFTARLLAALERDGITGIRREDVSDLARGERKVGGACLYRPRGAALYTATLLVDPRVELMERYLAHPPREPAWRAGRTHAEFVGRLAPGSGPGAVAELVPALAAALRADP
jgi:lipoate-protein ligase A